MAAGNRLQRRGLPLEVARTGVAGGPAAVTAPTRIQEVRQFQFPWLWRHPEQSRFSGGARDLARSAQVVRARSLGPLVKARAFGMTHLRCEHYRLRHYQDSGSTDATGDPLARFF